MILWVVVWLVFVCLFFPGLIVQPSWHMEDHALCVLASTQLKIQIQDHLLLLRQLSKVTLLSEAPLRAVNFICR